MNNENNVMKLCSFYVSDWHLITMLIPYISKKINEETKIATILENDIQNNVEVLLEKLSLKNEEKILSINWKNIKEVKYSKVSKILEKENEGEVLIIVNGTKKYIEKVNIFLDKYIQNNLEKIQKTNVKIKIINCYEIIEFNGSIVEILDNHDKILNTSGEKEINEVFEDYNRKEKIG